jgi:hypothetical protein
MDLPSEAPRQMRDAGRAAVFCQRLGTAYEFLNDGTPKHTLQGEGVQIKQLPAA